MPTIQSAKQIAENGLRTIGAFPSSRPAPDPGEMKTALRWLEMLLNFKTGSRPVGGFWQVFDIELEAGIGDYNLSDYCEERGVNQVFSASIVDQSGELDPLEVIYESAAATENLSRTGRPERVSVTKDGNGVLRLFPEPTQVEQDAGLVVRIRVQTYHDSIDETGVGDENIRLRPSWYLWITKRLGYELGSGPVRRLAEGELKRLEEDAEKLESALLARDSQYTSGKPPVTEPVAGSVDDYPYCNGHGSRRGYRKV